MIKNIFIGLILILLTFFIYQGEVDQKEIAEVISEPVEKITMENTPFNLDNQYHCLASNIYWEARNQSLLGKIAIAQVTLNRVDNSKYPNTVCGVVTQTRYYPSGRIDLHSCQFSWYCDGNKDEPIETWGFSYDESFNLAVNFLEKRPIDVTAGSTHYHNVKIEPYWTASLQEVVEIEEHIFYK
jgi:spore germination cell wall hydrolase CwlJ-like protein